MSVSLNPLHFTNTFVPIDGNEALTSKSLLEINYLNLLLRICNDLKKLIKMLIMEEKIVEIFYNL